MNKLTALLKLIRWPNLVFIALTQFLVYGFIVLPSAYQNTNITSDWPRVITPWIFHPNLWLLILSTILIAAAGYMINDYFDVRIDAVNKPDKLILSKVISRKAMISWHVILNALALLLVIKLALNNQLRLLAIQLFCITALVVYSMSFKRKLFIGNILVGLLIGFSVLLVGIYESEFKVLLVDNSYSKLIWLYTIFAFLITLIREIIKDAEDMKGDLKEGCRTIPIVYGLALTKKIIYVIYFFLLGFVFAVISNLFATNAFLCIYFMVGVILPSLYLLYKVKLAKKTTDFAKLSSWVKWLTLSGILSMILIQF
jgi:4-hydroxybenzoate polyprenyltransferase